MKWWFKRHPELLQRETHQLERDSNYRQHAVHRDNLLLSCGEILVRLDQVLKYPILIVYPHSYPYSLPFIFLLNELLRQEEIEKLAALEVEGIAANLKGKVKFYSNYRHQSPNGTLCILEADNLVGGANFYSTRSVISRVRDWFAAQTTGRFPIDSSEVELFAHFQNRINSIEFLYPEIFNTDEFVQGEFYAVPITSLPIKNS